jgi:hypothetical protein
LPEEFVFHVIKPRGLSFDFSHTVNVT